MTWLLALYPSRWRKRYGAEFQALIAPQPFSFGTAVDIIGGAIDAWTQPQAHLLRTAAHSEGDATMLAKAMRLRCAGYGAKTGIADGMKGATMILVATALSVLVGKWMRRQPIDPAWARTVISGGWLIGFILSQPYTTTKGWPARRQAISIGVQLIVVTLLMFSAAWLRTR